MGYKIDSQIRPKFVENDNLAATIDGRVTLRTMLIIRWVTIIGQAMLIMFFGPFQGLDFPILESTAVVGSSVLLNLTAYAHRGANARLSERDATLYLCYDLIQMSLLIYYTGGLYNPFAAMMMVPLAVAAMMLTRISVLILTAVMIVLLSSLVTLSGGETNWLREYMGLNPDYKIIMWSALAITGIYLVSYVWIVALEQRKIIDALAASQIALAREQRLSSLGALAAATAHELGTPLATISLIAKELKSELLPDDPLYEDIEILVDQSERCRFILTEFGQSPDREGGDPYEVLTLEQLVKEALVPHEDPAIEVDYLERMDPNTPDLLLRRLPEIVHGLGNYLQNAIQFAASQVKVRARVSQERVVVSIVDDGPGFPTQTLARLGEPYISGRDEGRQSMGLGVFIASTLLQKTGAKVHYTNSEKSGAMVVVSWDRPMVGIEIEQDGEETDNKEPSREWSK